MKNMIDRRLAFWDNCSHDLQQFLKELDARAAEKFVDEKDKQIIELVRADIKNAMINSMRRYGNVIFEFVSIQDGEEANNNVSKS